MCSLLELIFEAIIDGCFYSMQRIIPEKWLGKNFRIILKILVGIFSVILFISIFLGLFALISDDSDTKEIGRYLVFIPLAISGFQIFLGIIVHIITNKK